MPEIMVTNAKESSSKLSVLQKENFIFPKESMCSIFSIILLSSSYFLWYFYQQVRPHLVMLLVYSWLCSWVTLKEPHKPHVMWINLINLINDIILLQLSLDHMYSNFVYLFHVVYIIQIIMLFSNFICYTTYNTLNKPSI